jgi:hypothetical protein
VVPRKELERVEGRCQSSSTPTLHHTHYTGIRLL